jgi:predicted dehydrogenase
MDYKLGVVGLGHWFSWLTAGLGVEGGLELVKAVGTKPFEDKKELLSSFGISRENYYISDDEGRIPDGFFDGIDMVHISDPNKFHALQITDSLRKGKHVVTEKTIAIDEDQFNEIKSFIVKNGYQDRLYLHLHYLHKQPTIQLKESLQHLVKEHGRIKSIEASFFEPVNGEDVKRTWVLDMQNGGIFMDWVHPYEVIAYSTGCSFGNILDLKNIIINPSYSTQNASGVEAKVELKGDSFVDGASATVRVAKGVPDGYANKSIKIHFESGAQMLMCFPSHDAEFNTKERGKLVTIGTDGSVLSSKILTGKNSSEIFVKEIMDFREGKHDGLKLDDIERIFKPQWEYQKLIKSSPLLGDNGTVSKFLEDGTRGMSCAGN